MLRPEHLMVGMGAARDQVLALIGEHERSAHQGQPCWSTRASAIAYLMHCLAVRDDVLVTTLGYLREYDALCQDRQCGHNQG